jgi:hypothetical protein
MTNFEKQQRQTEEMIRKWYDAEVKTIQELQVNVAKLKADYEICRDAIFLAMRTHSQVLMDRLFDLRDVVWADYCKAQEELEKAKLEQGEAK